MRSSTIYAVAFLILLLLLVGVTLIWYGAPTQIEDLDSMLYCACGYSKVQCKDGKITMVRYHHDTVKSGALIGRYTKLDHEVEITIYFRGKTNVARCKMDHLGLLAPAGMMWEYEALNSRSLKLWIHRHVH